MKKISVFLLCLPFFSYAQDNSTEKTKQSVPKTEIGLSVGYAPDNAMNKLSDFRGGYLRNALTALRNFGNTQIGLTVEGGTNSNDYMYMMPGVVFNHKFHTGKSYFYAGAMGGYTYQRDMMGFGNYPGAKPYNHGYVLGLQGGYVLNLCKHWAFTSEVAFRSVQTWQRGTTFVPRDFTQAQPTDYVAVPYVFRDFNTYIPVTIGFRYRF